MTDASLLRPALLHAARGPGARTAPSARARARTPTRLPAIDPRRAAYPARRHAALDGRRHPTLRAWAWRIATLLRQLEEVRCLRALARQRRARRGLAAAYGFLGAQRAEATEAR